MPNDMPRTVVGLRQSNQVTADNPIRRFARAVNATDIAAAAFILTAPLIPGDGSLLDLPAGRRCRLKRGPR